MKGKAMKIAVESYCYHRFFGEWYPGLQSDPGQRMTVWDFLRRARELAVSGVTLDAYYLEPLDDPFVDRLSDSLQECSMDVVWGWGHWFGLRNGEDPEAARDLVRHLGIARRVGAKVMRICAGGWRTRPAPGSWPEYKARLLPMLRDLVAHAEDQAVVMALENHLDLTTNQIVDIITSIDSPWLGVCMDTGNFLRMMEDPVASALALAPYTRATHIKDLASTRGNPNVSYFWGSVVLGEGAVDLVPVIDALQLSGYDGQLAVEIDYLHPRYHEDEDFVVARSVEYLRSLNYGR